MKKASEIYYLSKHPEAKEKGDVLLSETKHLKGFMLYLNSQFRQEVREIRDRFEIQDEYDINEIERLFGDEILLAEARKLRKSLKLTSRWDDYILEYIITNETIPSYDIDGLRLEIKTDSVNEKEYLLHLTENSTLKDIILTWPMIEKLVGVKKSREKPWKKFWRDYTIYELNNEGKTLSEIYKIINDKYGEDLDYGNIKKIASSFKKRLNISNKQKLKTHK